MIPSTEKRGKSKSPYRRVSFEIMHPVPYGMAVYVCGSLPELGNWQPCQALRLVWCKVYLYQHRDIFGLAVFLSLLKLS